VTDDQCFACETANGRASAPGGLIWETGRWAVDHCVGPLGVGTLIVKPKRHVVHVADLDDVEAVELGPLLRNVAAVVTALTEPEQVYNTLWSHIGGQPVHIHYVVHPVTRSLMDRYGHGARLQPAVDPQRWRAGDQELIAPMRAAGPHRTRFAR
jgi:diadenosine tetraphosphate (Ap4A) HIT family hydrolase